MNEKQKFLIEFYLDYVNNFITVDYMAEFYGLNSSVVKAMIKEGKELNNF